MRVSRWSFAAVVALVLVASGSSGCASAKARFNSKADLDGAVPIAKVLVFTNMKSKGFTDRVNAGFEKGLMAGLAACGVKGEILQADPLALDAKEKFQATLATLQPDAALFIKRDGGNITVSSGGTNSELIFELQLVEMKTKKQRWLARSLLNLLTNNVFADDNASGEDFGAGIVNRLQQDGVLKGCPPGGVVPPYRAAMEAEEQELKRKNRT
jgi:hypothetical protein